jgi:hypothetical protein
MAKLYIDIRVHFDPKSNQDTLHKIAEDLKNHLSDLFDGRPDSQREPWEQITEDLQTTDVTYEVVMDAGWIKHIIKESPSSDAIIEEMAQGKSEQMEKFAKDNSLAIDYIDRGHQCQCPNKSSEHEGGLCQHRVYARYFRKGDPSRLLWLCAECRLPSDRQVE